MSTALLYLHGFNSSPASYKAQALQATMHEQGLADQLCIPSIEPWPSAAHQQLLAQYTALQQQFTRVAVAGSSLGGFYATILAERFGCRAVLINPAVRPHLLLQKYIGENVNVHTAERWQFDATHVEQLRALDVDTISLPERYLLMLQTGDETLDYRDAKAKYEGSALLLEEGGDHGFSGFEQHIPRLLEFCDIIRPHPDSL